MVHVFLFTLLWLFNLLNGTGLGNAYYTTEILMISSLLCSIVKFGYNIFNIGKFKVKTNLAFTFICFFVIAILSSFFNNKLNFTLQFLWVYFLVYLIGETRIKEKNFKLICNIYGILGVCILYIFNYTQWLSGWNDNTISMIALYSYLFFLLPHYGERNFIRKTLVLLVSLIYFFILIETNSRAAMLFSILAFLFTMFNSNRKIIDENNVMYFMLIPLIISLFVVMVSNTTMLDALNTWSMKEFDKPIFNGRDELWIAGFNILKNNIFLGSGNILKANWHNSSITLLASYGILGYIAWLLNMKCLLKNSLNKNYDKFLSGSIVMFFVMYAHQSVELGFISVKPNLLPYIMLGIVLSRSKHLERLKKYE